jgi:PAS domain S-box-containing protein
LNEAVLRQLIDALADGIVLVGEDGRIMLANRRAAAMFGYQPDEVGGQLVESLMPGAG